MASTIFTINDFPAEMIERFAPDLRPRTVSTLRLVSKRFRDVFTADKYYRSYLCYHDRLNLYRKELDGQKGRWRRLLEAEKRRLENWRNGRSTREDIVEFPRGGARTLKGIIDEEGEYWIMCKCRNKNLFLLNFTKEPIFTTFDMSCYEIPMHWGAEIAPGQIVLSESDVCHVFNYLKNSDSLSLEYKFKIEGMQTDRVIISRKTNVVSGQRNLLISYKNASDEEGLMRVWDITDETELESIALRDFSPFKMFFDQHHRCYLHLFTGTFPNVLVTASDDQDLPSYSVAAIVNVETRQMTNFFGLIDNLDLRSLFFTDSFAYLVNCNRSDEIRTLNLYAVRKTFDIIRQQPTIFTLSLSCAFFHSASLVENTILTDIDVFSGSKRHRYAISIDGSEITDKIYPVPENTEIRYLILPPQKIIGPFLIFESRNDIITFDERGNELFDWMTKLQEHRLGRGQVNVVEENVHFLPLLFLRPDRVINYKNFKIHHATFPPEIEHLHNLFKYTLQNGDGNLVIFNF